MPVAESRENRLKAFKNKGKDTEVRICKIIVIMRQEPLTVCLV